MTDIGDDYTIETTVQVDGVAVAPGSITLTVTAPDGATSTPTLSNTSTGVYRATVTLAQAGRWRWEWVTTEPAGSDHGYVDVAADPPARLDLLATVADLEARYGALTAAQRVKAQTLLADASASVRSACRPHKFTSLIVDDVVTLRPVGTELHLPDPPVTAVASVVAIARGGAADIPMYGWSWDGLDRVLLNAPAVSGQPAANAYTWLDTDRHVGVFKVTYTHGQLPPDVIVAKVCQIVNRTLGAATVVEGVTQETIGQFSRQWQQSTGSPGSAVVLTQRDQRDLVDAGYRTESATISLGSG